MLLSSLVDDVVRPVLAGVVTKIGSVGRPVPELVEQVGGVSGSTPHEDVEVEAPDGAGTVPGECVVQDHLPLAIVLQEAEVLAHLLVVGGGSKKRVNLVNLFYQVDSISIKGTYPGYKKKLKNKKKCIMTLQP